MEFGLFIQNFVPNSRRETDPDAEHHAIFEDIEAVIAADKAGFKYVWLTEHHFLDEYSHLSANDVVAGYLAAKTERIHIGSGIFNPLPQVNHPAKVAERVNYLDQFTHGRFEFGTGRGAGSHEILGFLHHAGVTDTNATKEIWEDVIHEFPKMFMQETYEGHEGKYWSLPPRKILPRPYGHAHPAMWYAAGNPPSYEMAGRMGLGVLGFSLDSLDKVEKLRSAYKNGIANAEPVGAFVNDNIMSCIAAYVAEDKLPRHLPASRPHPGLAGTACGPDSGDGRARCEIWRPRHRRPRRRAAAVPALGRHRHRPARLRHRPRADRGDPRDHPAHRRARHPQDRHRPGVPYHQVPQRSQGLTGVALLLPLNVPFSGK
jgi:alkanesulfonate monooxygenase SsuD/methylene tetrahydromethanopterin reductase-like flavin-dependent oxidoreductase (luciferase family)